MMNKKKLELYVHIPFCAHKCAYCDFLSFPANVQTQKEYVDKVIEEIHVQSVLFQEYQVVTIFIGGGTPSYLEGTGIEAIMGAVSDSFRVRENAEITIEVNPGTIDKEKLDSYQRSGINRISLGLQSADDRELRALGRIHTFDEFLKSYQRVRMSGFTNINVDLMSALPGQTMESWRNTLKKVTMLKPEHISAYSLMIEEGTPYHERYGTQNPHPLPRGSEYVSSLPDLPDEDTEREMYHLTRSFLQELGYERYEISNYSKPGYVCQHNAGYWTGIEYLGIGLGSSSYIEGVRFHNESNLERYLKAHYEDESQFYHIYRQEMECLTLHAKMEEFMFLGLRMVQGVSQQDFASRLGHNIWDIYGSTIQRLQTKGLLEIAGGYIRLTEEGIDVSNYVLSEFLLD